MAGIFKFPEQSNHGGQSPDSDLMTYGAGNRPLSPRRLREILHAMGIEKPKSRKPVSLALHRRKREKLEGK